MSQMDDQRAAVYASYVVARLPSRPDRENRPRESSSRSKSPRHQTADMKSFTTIVTIDNQMTPPVF